MNYFLQAFIKDTKWWVGLFFVFLLVLSLAELITMMLLPKPIFNGWAIGITLIAFLSLFIYLLKKAYIRDKKIRDIKKHLPAFEQKKKEELKQYLSDHPDFQTFCFECKYFSVKVSACSLHIFKRNKFVKFDPLSKANYCLYWNAKIPKTLLEDVV